MDSPSLRINASIENENAMVIACFPSVGMVSSIVAHYLIDHLDLEFVGGLVDERLPALAMINEGVPLPPIAVQGPHEGVSRHSSNEPDVDHLPR